jgi:hypothetical protein
MHKIRRRSMFGKYTVWALPLLSCSAFSAAADHFTPLLASALTRNTQVFPGTDGRKHLVYELIMINANATPATLQKVEVAPAADPSRSLAAYQGNELLAHLRSTANTAAASPGIEFNGARVFLIHIALPDGAAVPQGLVHRLTLLGGATPAPQPQTPVALEYPAAPLAVGDDVPKLGPPLRGKGWVAFNGCCEASGVHRSASQTVNGGLYFAQRFAIDWMRQDAAGRLVNGNATDVHSWTDYGSEVIAVADGRVVETEQNLDDQIPGSLPDPKTITLANVDGNHIVLDLGNGMFAFYAHLQRNSLTVSPGEHVTRGQILARLGNTGNTSAPHLHFHLMDGTSTLGSNGIPYVIDTFTYAGAVPAAKFRAAATLEGTWNEGLLRTPSVRHAQFPMDLAVVDF